MKKLFLALLLISQVAGASFAQESEKVKTKTSEDGEIKIKSEGTGGEKKIKSEGSEIKIKNESSDDSRNYSPHHTRFAVDAPIITLGVAGSATGLYLIQENKHAPSAEELAAIDADPDAAKKDVPKFDRWSAGYFSLDAKKTSDYPFYASFGLPFLLLLDEGPRGKAGQVFVLYLETMAITGTLFTMTVGNVERKRPLVYNNDPDNTERTKKHAQNSFFAGHTAASASACFFAAKIWHDYHPDSEWRPVVWGLAGAIPATVGYYRLKAGKHFLSDNILGFVLGASTGILVPQLHKTKGMENVSIIPVTGPYNGMAATVTF